MKILDAKVNWWEGYGNVPNFQLLVADLPALSEHRYLNKGSLYFSECRGSVQFFSYNGPSNGFGGRVFDITLIDGTEKSLKGPFSSNSGYMNKYFATQSGEVSITEDPIVWRKGYTFFSGAVTLDMLIEAARLCQVYLLKIEWFPGVVFYVPSLSPDAVVKQGVVREGNERNDKVLEVMYAPEVEYEESNG